MKRRRRQHGFTLVELITASSITVLVAGSTGMMLLVVNGAQRRADMQTVAQQNARAAITALATAVRNAHRPLDNAKLVLEGVDEWNGQMAADRVQIQTVSRRTIRRGQPESDVRLVEFRLSEPDDDRLPSLMRRTDPTHNDPDDEGGVVEQLIDDVVMLNIEYFDGERWQDAWQAERDGRPMAVRVQLAVQVDGRRGTVLTVSRLVNFPAWPSGARETES